MSSRLDVGRLLTVLSVRATLEGNRYVACCPHPGHKEKTPSWSMLADGEKAGAHHCFGCGFNGGPWELVAAVRGLTLEEAGKWLRAELGGSRTVEEADVPLVRVERPRTRPSEMVLPFGVQLPSVDGSPWFQPAYEYLTKPVAEGGRGVAPWQLERWHVGYAVSGRSSIRMRVVVPVFTRGRLLSYVARAFINDGRPRYDVASPRPDKYSGQVPDPGARPDVALFGEPGFEPPVQGQRRVATVVEGVFGMLAFERAGAPNPCAVLGASNLGPEKVELLSQFDVLLVGTDPDAAGDSAYGVIRDALCRWTEVRRIPLVHKPDEAPGEYLEEAWRETLART